MSEGKELIKVFDYTGKEVRTIIKEGEPWFVVKDVCNVLEIVNHKDAISRLSEKMKGVAITDTLGGKQEMLIVSEAGVYKLVFTSRKPEAERFTDWLATDVIPSIRKHGMYATESTIEQMINNPDFTIQLLMKLKEEQEAKKKAEEARIIAEEIIEKQKPKVEIYDAFISSKDCYTFQHASNIMGIKGLGQNNLFKLLRGRSILTKKNLPYREYIDSGYFIVVVKNFTKKSGEPSESQKTLITPKGLKWIAKNLLSLGYEQVVKVTK